MATRSRSAPKISEGDSGSAEASSLAAERNWLIGIVLNRLAARDREALTRYYLKGQSPNQICAEMAITDTQFRLLRSGVREKLGRLGSKRRLAKPPTREKSPAEGSVINIDRIIPIVAHAVAVFGDEQKASHWLATPLGLLGNRSPAQVLARGDDGEKIDQILTRIEHNIPS